MISLTRANPFRLLGLGGGLLLCRNVDDRLSEAGWVLGVRRALGGLFDLIRINEARAGSDSLTELGEFQNSSKGSSAAERSYSA